MLSTYEDLFALADRLGEKPRWFDVNGAPRFCDHHPHHCTDIYAHEVVLVLISCQRCGKEIPVQMSTHRGPGVFAKAVKDGMVHYGDPPVHDHDGGEYCHAGCTMNCWDLRVLEFWRRNGFKWERVPELEIDLPDLKDPDRLSSVEPHP